METNDKQLSRFEPVAAGSAAPSARTAADADVAEAAPPKSRRRPFIIVLSVIGLLLAAIGAYLVFTAGEEDTDDAQVFADLVPVGTRVAGQIVKIAVKENQLVKKGQLI